MVMNELNRKALTVGVAAALAVVGSIWLGSGALIHFDPALIWYAIGSVLATFAVAYRFKLLGFNAGTINVHSVRAWLMFNLLNLSAVLVMIGLVLAGFRRLVNVGERAVQTFAEDILPLVLIFAVSATGLMLTVSYKFLAGHGHSQVARIHAASVIALLFYIPFGKLFHIFQRTCALCVSLYKTASHSDHRASDTRRRCGQHPEPDLQSHSGR